MKTNIYIDGFNLYYGCLKGTTHKWLDLKKLFEFLLPPPKHQISKIKFFTARVSGTKDDPDKPNRQDTYLAALAKHIPDIEIFYGHFTSHKVRMPLVKELDGQWMAEVIKTEEKGSDVNLALEILNDAWTNDYECAVLVSNDSDLAHALKLIKQNHKKNICLVTAKNTHPSKQLAQYTDSQKIIREGVLKISQLPDLIPGTTIKKPRDWY